MSWCAVQAKRETSSTATAVSSRTSFECIQYSGISRSGRLMLNKRCLEFQGLNKEHVRLKRSKRARRALNLGTRSGGELEATSVLGEERGDDPAGGRQRQAMIGCAMDALDLVTVGSLLVGPVHQDRGTGHRRGHVHLGEILVSGVQDRTRNGIPSRRIEL